MHIEGFTIEYYPPYKSSSKTINFVSLEDEIAFMTRFYPPSKFLKLTLEQTSTSSLQLSGSDSSHSISSKSVNQPQIEPNSLKDVGDIKDYDVSEIKALTKIFASNSKNFKGKDLKQFNQSQFEYRQLLDELSFHENHIKQPFSSQKYKNQNYHFQFSEGESSFVSEQKMDCFHQIQNNQEQFIQKKSTKSKIILTKEFRWDPPTELLFIKKNKLQRIFWILSKPTTFNYRQFMDKFINAKKYLKPLFTCISCQTKFLRKNKKKKCQNCQDRKKEIKS